MPSNNKLQEVGISLPCKKRLTTLTTSFSRIASGCAVLFNKDTFHPNVDVKSIYLNDTRRDLPDQVMEGEQGWVLQGVLSRAIFRRPPVSGQKYFNDEIYRKSQLSHNLSDARVRYLDHIVQRYFTVLSLRTSNIYAKKKGIAKKLILTLRAIMSSQEVDLVAGD